MEEILQRINKKTKLKNYESRLKFLKNTKPKINKKEKYSRSRKNYFLKSNQSQREIFVRMLLHNVVEKYSHTSVALSNSLLEKNDFALRTSVRKLIYNMIEKDSRTNTNFTNLLPTLEYCSALKSSIALKKQNIKNSVFICGPSAVGKSILMENLASCVYFNDRVSWEIEFENDMEFFDKDNTKAWYFVGNVREKIDQYRPTIYKHSPFCAIGRQVVCKLLKIFINWMNVFRQKLNLSVIEMLPEILIDIFFNDVQCQSELENKNYNTCDLKPENYRDFLQTILFELKTNLEELQKRELLLNDLLSQISYYFEKFFDSLKIIYDNSNSTNTLDRLLNDKLLDISHRIFHCWCYKFSHKLFQIHLNHIHENLNKLKETDSNSKLIDNKRTLKKNIFYIVLDMTPDYVNRYITRLNDTADNDVKNLFYLNLQFVMYCALLNIRNKIRQSSLKNSLIIRMVLIFNNLNNEVIIPKCLSNFVFSSRPNQPFEDSSTPYRIFLYQELKNLILSDEQRKQMWMHINIDFDRVIHNFYVQSKQNKYPKSVNDYMKMVTKSMNYVSSISNRSPNTLSDFINDGFNAHDDIYNLYTTCTEYKQSIYSRSVYDYIKTIVESQNFINSDSLNSYLGNRSIGKDSLLNYSKDILICSKETFTSNICYIDDDIIKSAYYYEL